MRRSYFPDLSRFDDLRTIMIVRLKALGDIVLSLPIIYALRERFPDADIRYLCRGRYMEALGGETGLDGVVELPEGVLGQCALLYRLRRRRIDLVLDLLGSPRSALITRMTAPRVSIGMDVGHRNWCYHYVLPREILRDGRRVKLYTLEANREIVRMLNIWDRDEWGGKRESDFVRGRHRLGGDSWREGLAIGFPAAEKEREWARRYVRGLAVDPDALVGVVPAATYHSKSWPVARFVELSRILVAEMGLVPVVIWGPGEESYADEITGHVPRAVKAPDTGIARLGALIGEMRLLVTLDSGPKHLAVIQGVPTVTLFGPTDPHIWDPMNGLHRAVYHDIDCSPCRDRNCESNRCLLEITPREVANIVADLLPVLPGRRIEDREEV